MNKQAETDQIAAMIRQARSAQNMSRQQLAEKCSITRGRIAKAENDAGSVTVSVLRTIVEKGLGGQFSIKFEF